MKEIGKTVRKGSGQDVILRVVSKAFIGIYAVICLLPMVLVLMVSLTAEESILKNGYSFFPDSWSLHAYTTLLHDPIFFSSIRNSLFITIVGTILATAITAMAAYGLSHPMLHYKNRIAMFFYITMVFNAGIVPWYLVCNMMNLKENLAALIVPKLMFSVFNLFLARNYMSGLDKAILESAIIDGAGDFTVAFKIYFPLSKPVLATIALFYSIDYWNDWYNTIMLVPFTQKLYPVQYLLFKLQNEVSMLAVMGASAAGLIAPRESLKMATAIITIGPVILFYPYLQKYFVKGIVIGAVKG